MRVLLDDNPCPLTSDTVEEAIAEAATLAGAQGRLIVEVEVDGQAWSERELAEAAAHAAPVEELRLTTAEPRTLVVRTLGDASEALVTADELQREAAALIDADSMDQAMERLGHAFRIWSDVHESVAMSAQVMSLNAGELDAGGRLLNDAVDKLIAQLHEMSRVLKGRDPVGLSDALQYEFPEVIREWRAMLDQVCENLEKDEGA